MANNTPKVGPTFIDGIGSTVAIDTASEIVDLAGIDCFSLIGSPFNYEHKSDLPAQIVGKILDYKKIFSDADCENERQKYYWDKCKTPYLYVIGRLFDDKKDSSKEVAALFMDDAEHPDEPPMVGFSIEGSKVEKVGIVVTKSIARKITITGNPANKQCVAEMLPLQKENTPAEDSIFKSEPSFTIQLLGKSEKLNKSSPSKGAMWSKPKTTGDSIHFSHPEHGTVTIQKQPSGEYHVKHRGTLVGLKGNKGVHKDPKKASEHARDYMNALTTGKVTAPKMYDMPSPSMATHSMTKALTAGSMMAAPGNLTQGAALGKESLEGKSQKVNKLKKFGDRFASQTLARAEQEYRSWSKREEFENFMAKTMPHLTKGEITAIGQTLCLSKSMRAEKKLAKLMAMEPIHSFLDKSFKEPVSPEVDAFDLHKEVIKTGGHLVGGTVREGSQYKPGEGAGSMNYQPGTEKFHYMGMVFDIDAIRDVFGANAQNAVVICTPDWSKGINIDTKEAMRSTSTNPLIIATLPLDSGLKHLLIDGHHRQYKACQDGRAEFPAHILSPEDTLKYMDTYPDLMSKMWENVRNGANEIKKSEGVRISILDPEELSKIKP